MHEPFFFLIDFEQQQPIICPLHLAAKNGIYFSIRGHNNLFQPIENLPPKLIWHKYPMTLDDYAQGFHLVQQEIQAGNTYLLNLTYPTPIDCNYSLAQLFTATKAPYKLLLENKFVCFSPECFVRTQQNKIYSYPMKGTINANLPQAREKLLTSTKEQWEHNTIVDLIRNDLAIVANNITVQRFRYAEKIATHNGEIWQTSSEICGDLPTNWQQNPLALIQQLLPAGSISGAPKEKTCAIIRAAEKQPRGYYTGVFGLFDGENIDSAVIIRYIEQSPHGQQFRSGGGITAQSTMMAEYNELLDKVYVPLF